MTSTSACSRSVKHSRGCPSDERHRCSRWLEGFFYKRRLARGQRHVRFRVSNSLSLSLSLSLSVSPSLPPSLPVSLSLCLSVSLSLCLSLSLSLSLPPLSLSLCVSVSMHPEAEEGFKELSKISDRETWPGTILKRYQNDNRNSGKVVICEYLAIPFSSYSRKTESYVRCAACSRKASESCLRRRDLEQFAVRRR